MAGDVLAEQPTVLVHTSIIIPFINNDPQVVARVHRARIVTAAIVVGELYLGPYTSNRVPAEIAKIESLLTTTIVLNCDVDTAKHYAWIRYMLSRAGTPIPENDIWIAATAQRYQLPLISRDDHFTWIPQFKHEVW